VTRDASFFEALDALVTDATHHVLVVDAFHGRAVRVITPADVLRAVAAPGRAAIGWRYRERSDAEDPPLESASREKKTKAGDEKTFADGVRRAGGCLGALEISDDFKKRDDERNGVPVGFAGRFDDEM
jgi:CBS domain-containing protein